MLCNFGLKSYLWFQIELAPRTRSILESRVWIQPKLHFFAIHIFLKLVKLAQFRPRRSRVLLILVSLTWLTIIVMCIKRSYGRDNHPFVIIFVCLFFSVLLCFVVVVIFFIVCFFPNVSVAFSHYPSLARERKC